MSSDLARAMREATELTRASKLADATRVIQQALSGRRARDMAPSPDEERADRPLLLDGPAEGATGGATMHAHRVHGSGPLGPRTKWSLGEVVKTLRRAKFRGSPLPMGRKAGNTSPMPEGAQFLNRSFTGPAGTRTYKLYLPAGRVTTGLPLVVMLHGCTQDPDDFAVGTRMNALAEEFGFLVAYPCQPATANPSSCWNWFEVKDQTRGRGEPSLIAGITEEVVAEYRLDRSRVFVAGLSAGGAMAAVMAATYPDVCAAIGVHSGLAYGAARDVMSAFAAMRGEIAAGATPQVTSTKTPRAIVFHGDADHTVHPANGARIVGPSDVPGEVATVEIGTAGGRAFTRTVTREANGTSRTEHWLIAGAGHAWSGGNPAGSYADAAGPDASREMVRFFLKG